MMGDKKSIEVASVFVSFGLTVKVEWRGLRAEVFSGLSFDE
jgi:hypothetical protein